MDFCQTKFFWSGPDRYLPTSGLYCSIKSYCEKGPLVSSGITNVLNFIIINFLIEHVLRLYSKPVCIFDFNFSLAFDPISPHISFIKWTPFQFSTDILPFVTGLSDIFILNIIQRRVSKTQIRFRVELNHSVQYMGLIQFQRRFIALFGCY